MKIILNKQIKMSFRRKKSLQADKFLSLTKNTQDEKSKAFEILNAYVGL